MNLRLDRLPCVMRCNTAGQPAASSVAVGPPEQAPAAPLVAVTASAAGGHGSKPGLPGKLAAPLVTVTACWSRFWAIQVLQDQASQLTVIAKHLGMRSAKSGVAPVLFIGWVVQHDYCALVIHMKEQVS